MLKNLQVDAYRVPRQLKQHEKRQLELIREACPAFDGRCVDIGCANGTLIRGLTAAFPHARFVGIDTNTELLELARQSSPTVEFTQADALSYEPRERFDMAVASGVLSIFEDFTVPLDRWLSWLNPGAPLFVFGPFNSRDVDTIVRFRNNFTGSDWEGGLTSYSVHTIGRYLQAQGKSFAFERFDPSFDLAEREDPIRTFTVRLENGERMVISGANIVTEYFFLTIRN